MLHRQLVRGPGVGRGCPHRHRHIHVQAQAEKPDEGPKPPRQRRRRRAAAPEQQPFTIDDLNPVNSEPCQRLQVTCLGPSSLKRAPLPQCAVPCGGRRHRCRRRLPPPAAAPPDPAPPSAVGRKSREVFDDVWTQLQRIGNPARSSPEANRLT